PGARPAGPSAGLSAVWLGGLASGGARAVGRLEWPAARGPSEFSGQQHSLSHPAVGACAALGQPSAGASGRAFVGGLAAEIWASDLSAGEFRGAAAFCGHLLSGGRLG